ncbi:glycoside hydrolase family 65 protein [Oceanidesulfovibrio indonesiensis]|uniref:Glycoside hydrolase family 65 protein n=1 Tax=Oceanidesulfovibrio indonesiensis TaxID=54767 RepID=A0A7M3MGU7_9BACT|nr:glycosyl hydrolase family 65 protein [Oceanidesulfovibrio indonesiensis]TVM18707.1 glycoside hydrolase family 65 protein [Oceanidesulfovibrio indonesiensis]
MIHRRRVDPPRHIYPVNPWRIVESRFHPPLIGMMESIMAVSNGYIGVRGWCDEGEPAHERGMFVNGFHETWPIVYGEEAHGFAKTGQTMCNVHGFPAIRLFVDDEPLYLPTAVLQKYERVLDMRRGVLERELLWETPAGKLVRVRSTRMVSLTQRHLGLVSYEVTMEKGSAPIALSSELRPGGGKQSDGQATESYAGIVMTDDPRKAQGAGLRPQTDIARNEGTRLELGLKAERSGMGLGIVVDHSLHGEARLAVDSSWREVEGGSLGTVDFSGRLEEGQTVRLEKIAAYHSSRSRSPEELILRGRRTVKRGILQGAASLLEEQREHLDEFWKCSDIRIDMEEGEARHSTDETMQAIRFNLFQIHQAAARAEGGGVPAKGLTGQAYEGHYFWDSEIYVMPALLYTEPRLAKNLLRFRFGMLDQARYRAKEMSQRGAMFPWRTINGKEASAYYAAGTAQYHINADIAYALRKYVTATGDMEFLFEEGMEVLVETARLWADLGFYSRRKGGAFCIDSVTGPDEYTTVVDNNLFTNLMARENLRFAAASVAGMREAAPEEYKALVYAVGLNEDEPKEWLRAADAMFIPYDEELGIHPQDDSFLDKEEWDFENTPQDKYPLLLHFHPLVIYRYKVIKQADAVLAMYLLSHNFTLEEKRRNFDYYDQRTTGDSSLSVGIQGIVAMEVGEREKAREYFLYATLMDLGDVAGNAHDGLHVASMGAVWMALTGGMLGLRDDDGCIRFSPRKLPRLRRFEAPLTIRGCRLRIVLDRDDVTYDLEDGEALTFFHDNEEIDLSQDNPRVTLPLVNGEE